MKTIKEALFDTVHKNKKPLKVIAEEIGVSENYLYRAATPDSEESDTGTGCRFPLKKLIPLVRSTGDFQVLDVIEHSLGRAGVLLPPLSGMPAADITRLTIQTIGEFGELLKEIEIATRDRKITAAESESIQRKGYPVIQAILQFMAAGGDKL